MIALADKFAHAVSVERNAIRELAQPDNYVRMELASQGVVRIWIVPAIDRVSMASVWIHVFVIMLAERMPFAKYLNTERFACVQMDSKVNRSKDAHRTNAKRMMTVTTINNVIMVRVKILAFNPVHVASMLSAA